MVTVIAKDSFSDNRLGDVKRRQQFELQQAVAQTFVDAGLMEYAADTKPLPPSAPGKQPSALPAGQASLQTTAKPSKRGRARKAAEES